MLNFMPTNKLYHTFIINDEKLHCSICITIKRVHSPLLGMFVFMSLPKLVSFLHSLRKLQLCRSITLCIFRLKGIPLP